MSSRCRRSHAAGVQRAPGAPSAVRFGRAAGVSVQFASVARVFSALILLALVAGCERETRDFQGTQHVGQLGVATTRLTDLQPGSPSAPPMLESPYHDNAWAMAEGKRLFAWFNCVGCHHHGGGGIGPALMDHRWIYGSRPDQIYSSIVQGRPNGMPAFGQRLTDQQVWQLVAYVESMSGRVPNDAAPGRDDAMQTTKPELRKEPEPPRQTGHR